MPAPLRRARHCCCLIAASTCLVLLTSWGGPEYAWDSRVVLGLGAGAGAAAAALPGRRALRRLNPSSRCGCSATPSSTSPAWWAWSSASPCSVPPAICPPTSRWSTGPRRTESGLLMLPMMGGIVGASVVSGQMISRTGRYRSHPGRRLPPCPSSACGCCLRLETGTPRPALQRLDVRPRRRASAWACRSARSPRAQLRAPRGPRHRHQCQQLLPADRRQRRRRCLRHPVRRTGSPTRSPSGSPPTPLGRRPTRSRSPPARALPAARAARRLRPGLRARHAAHLPQPRAGARPRPVHRLLPQGGTHWCPTTPPPRNRLKKHRISRRACPRRRCSSAVRRISRSCGHFCPAPRRHHPCPARR
ncbi:hypothetical protein STENM223S_04919 [Streptomyces tendae]